MSSITGHNILIGISPHRERYKMRPCPISSRRRLLVRAGLSLPSLLLASCASRNSKTEPVAAPISSSLPKLVPMPQLSLPSKPVTPRPIEVDVSGVTDVPSLIAAIKYAGRNYLPKNLKDEDFFDEIAKAFVEYAHAAADNGYPIPQWVLDKIPQRKTAASFLLATLVLWAFGVPFVLAVKIVVIAVLASIGLMTAAILGAIYLIYEASKQGST